MNKSLVAIKFASIIYIVIFLLLFVLSHPKAHAYDNFNEYVNNTVIQVKETDQDIRDSWEELLGFDLWMPYYKLEVIRKDISSSLDMKIYNFRGKLEYAKNYKEAMYVFRVRF